MSQQESEYAALQDAQLERDRTAAVEAEAKKQEARRFGNIKAREKLEVPLSQDCYRFESSLLVLWPDGGTSNWPEGHC
jgi:hypothetical protein